MELPKLIPFRNGSVKIGSKTFSRCDVNAGLILRENLISDPNWFGGRVYSFGKNDTYKGLLLCIEGQIDEKGNTFSGADVIAIYIPKFEDLNDASLRLLCEEGLYNGTTKEIEEPIIESIAEEMPNKPVDLVADAAILNSVNAIVNARLTSRSKKV